MTFLELCQEVADESGTVAGVPSFTTVSNATGRLAKVVRWTRNAYRDIQNERSDWKWMRTYRVWEANRKIFLFPENWLEPEFRDDKTHLYRALESELLQGDISNDTAERAFFNYLKGLEQIARLEMVSMYLYPNL